MIFEKYGHTGLKGSFDIGFASLPAAAHPFPLDHGPGGGLSTTRKERPNYKFWKKHDRVTMLSLVNSSSWESRYGKSQGAVGRAWSGPDCNQKCHPSSPKRRGFGGCCHRLARRGKGAAGGEGSRDR